MFKTKTGIVSIDIETSFMKLAEFGLKNSGYISPDNILEDWSIYCAAWKFLDEDKTHAVVVKPSDLKNDYDVVKKISEVLNESKLVIYHNGDKFDLKKINARLIYHNLPPIDHKLLTLDTLKMAKKYFGFTSNRLDYLARFLGIGKKLPHPEGNAWLKLVRGEKVRSTLSHMVEYCKYDVFPLLEKVYLRMRPYIQHPNLNDYRNESIACSHCGSFSLMKHGTRLSKGGAVNQRYKCQELNCGGYSAEKIQSGPKVR